VGSNPTRGTISAVDAQSIASFPVPASGEFPVPYTAGMGRRLVERRLRDVGGKLRSLRASLAGVEEQLAHLSDEAEEMGLRALVSETPGADLEYREARRHADAMLKHRNSVREAIAELEARQDQLLEQIRH
jgi:chromosome segregation ATPase